MKEQDREIIKQLIFCCLWLFNSIMMLAGTFIFAPERISAWGFIVDFFWLLQGIAALSLYWRFRQYLQQRKRAKYKFTLFPNAAFHELIKAMHSFGQSFLTEKPPITVIEPKSKKASGK